MKAKNHFVNGGKFFRTKSVQYVFVQTFIKLNEREIDHTSYNVDRSLNKIGFTDDFYDLIMNSKLNGTDFKVLFHIMKNLRGDCDIKIKVSDIAKEAGRTDQPIRDSLQKLKGLGVITDVRGLNASFIWDVNPFLLFKGNRIKYFKSINYPFVDQVGYQRKQSWD